MEIEVKIEELRRNPTKHCSSTFQQKLPTLPHPPRVNILESGNRRHEMQLPGLHSESLLKYFKRKHIEHCQIPEVA